MKRPLKALTSVLLASAIGCTALISASAAYSDTVGHPKEAAIDRWTGYGVVSGNAGAFNPDSTITRAEMARIMTSALGLRPAVGAQFTDVPANTWYAPFAGASANAGIMTGNGSGQFMPLDTLTWEQVLSVYSRSLCIEDGAAMPSGLTYSGWARSAVEAMAQFGVPAGTDLTQGVSRADVLAVLDEAVEAYICEPGVYDLSANTGKGVVVIAADNVTLTGTLRNDVVVVQGASPAAGSQKINVVINASSEHTVFLNGNDIVAEIPEGVRVKSGEITESSERSRFVVRGTMDTVTVDGTDAAVQIAGKVDSIEVGEQASGTDIEVLKGGKAALIKTAGVGTEVNGAGAVAKVIAEKTATDTVVTTPNTAIQNDSKDKVITEKGSVAAGETGKTNSKGEITSGSSSTSEYYDLKLTIVDDTEEKNTASASAEFKRTRNLLAAIAALTEENRAVLRQTFPGAMEMNAIIEEGLNAQGNDTKWAAFIADKKVTGDSDALAALKDNGSTLADLGAGTYTLRFTDTQEGRTDITYTVTIRISR